MNISCELQDKKRPLLGNYVFFQEVIQIKGTESENIENIIKYI